MKNYYFFTLLLILITGVAAAQRGDIFVRSGDKGLFIEHKVAPKENFFSIGRLYTVHPKYVAAYNKLDMNKGLAIGQLLQVPLSDTNFTQKGNSGVPLYYKTGAGEGLMKVSGMYKNVSLETLRNWNNLPSNSVDAGKNLVVGFLITKEMPSVTLAAKEPSQPVITKSDQPEVKKEQPAVVTAPPAQVKTVEVVEKKVEPKQEQKKPEPNYVSQQEKGTVTENGYFKSQFEQQVRQTSARKEETVTSGIFKTTSGWVDSKYYLLIDKIQPGTIVRITNPVNNKFIFAKVLGEMSGIKQNEGLNIRISSAGASALQVTETDKFILKVNY
jgi:hypothetical protein